MSLSNMYVPPHTEPDMDSLEEEICVICEDWDCESDCEEREQEELDILAYGEEFGSNYNESEQKAVDYANLTDSEWETHGQLNGWEYKEGRKYPGGDGTVWFSEGAPMRVWELQAALSRLNPTDHVIIAAPSDSRSDWLNVGCLIAPNGPDRENVSGVTLFPGQEWNSFDMAIDWDEHPSSGVFR